MFRRKKKKLTISSPTNFAHLYHSGVDSKTGEFVGLPIQWLSVIENQKDDKRKSLSTDKDLDNSSLNSRSNSVDPSNYSPTEINNLKKVVRGNQNNNQDFTLNSLSSNSLEHNYGGSLNSINFAPNNVQQSLSNSLNWINYPLRQNSNINLNDTSNQLQNNSLNQLNSQTIIQTSSPIKNNNVINVQLNSPPSNLVNNSLSSQFNNLSLNNRLTNISNNHSINQSLNNSSINSLSINSQPLANSSFINSSSSLNELNNSTSDKQAAKINQSQNSLNYNEQFQSLSPFQKHLYNQLPANLQQQFFNLPYPQQQQLLQAVLNQAKQQQIQSPQYQLQQKLKQQRQMQYLQEKERERQLQLIIQQKQNQQKLKDQLNLNNQISPIASINQQNQSIISNQSTISNQSSNSFINNTVNRQVLATKMTLDELVIALSSLVDNQNNPIGQYEFLKMIGEGSTATIFLCKNKHQSLINQLNKGAFKDELVVIKKMNLEKQKRRELVFNETRIMKDFKHPNIINMLNSYLVGNELWLTLEFCNAGILTDVLTTKKMNESQIATICIQVLNALTFLHSNKILHRDIKSDSLLLTDEGRVKLSDFGFATQISNQIQRRRSLVGTPYWMAPEIINRIPYGTEIDIWSFGILVLEMINCSPPFFNYPPLEAMKLIAVNEPQIQTSVPVTDELHDFLKRMLVKNPSERFTAIQLLEHPFLKFASSIDILKSLLTPFDLSKI